MQEKKYIKVVWYELIIPSLAITFPHSASLMMLTVTFVTELSVRNENPLKILNINDKSIFSLKCCLVY